MDNNSSFLLHGSQGVSGTEAVGGVSGKGDWRIWRLGECPRTDCLGSLSVFILILLSDKLQPLEGKSPT